MISGAGTITRFGAGLSVRTALPTLMLMASRFPAICLLIAETVQSSNVIATVMLPLRLLMGIKSAKMTCKPSIATGLIFQAI